MCIVSYYDTHRIPAIACMAQRRPAAGYEKRGVGVEACWHRVCFPRRQSVPPGDAATRRAILLAFFHGLRETDVARRRTSFAFCPSCATYRPASSVLASVRSPSSVVLSLAISPKNAFSSRSGTSRSAGGISSLAVFCRPESENASDCCSACAPIRVTSTVVTMAPFSHRRAGPT